MRMKVRKWSEKRGCQAGMQDKRKIREESISGELNRTIL